MGSLEKSERRSVFDTKLGGVFAIPVWILGRILSFFLFKVIGGILHYISRLFPK